MTTLFRRLRRALRPPRTLAFTRAGTFLVMMAFGVGFAAINTGNNLLFLLLGTMLAVILASGILSEAALRGLEVRRQLPTRAFAQTPASGHFDVDNPKAWPSLSVEFSEMDAVCTVGPLAGREFGSSNHAWWKFWRRRRPESDAATVAGSVAAGYCLRIDAGESRRVRVHYDFPARGVYRLTGLRAATRFPFSFFEKAREFRRESTFTVFPTTRDPGEWATRIRGAFGELSSDEPGRGDEYYGLREYRPGEDKRLIHWKRSASRGELVVKEHEARTSRAIRLHLCNATPRAAPLDASDRERFEAGLEQLAGLIEMFNARDWSVQLETLDRSGMGGAADPDAMLRALAETELHGEIPVDAFELEPDRDRADVLVALPSAAGRIPGDWDLVLQMRADD